VYIAFNPTKAPNPIDCMCCEKSAKNANMNNMLTYTYLING
jgi:hypothetical protein